MATSGRRDNSRALGCVNQHDSIAERGMYLRSLRDGTADADQLEARQAVRIGGVDSFIAFQRTLCAPKPTIRRFERLHQFTRLDTAPG